MSRVLEADDTGALTIPTELLKDPAPHARYIVESKGATLNIEPETVSGPRSLTWDEWTGRRDELAERIGRAWDTGKSAAEVVSEMRR